MDGIEKPLFDYLIQKLGLFLMLLVCVVFITQKNIKMIYLNFN